MAMTGVSKTSYYVSVHHRNHLPVMSASTVDFTAASPAFSFTTGLAQAWADAGVTSNNAMKEVETGIWGLWSGDANYDGIIKASGSNNDKQAMFNLLGVSTPGNTVSGYKNEDVNFDGIVKVSGANNDKQAIFNILGINTPGNIFNQHLPH